MSAAVCWLRLWANVEPPSSARPGEAEQRDQGQREHDQDLAVAASSPRCAAAAAVEHRASPSGHSIFALAELVKVTAPSSPASGVTGVNDELMVTRTQLPPLHGPVTAAPAMSMQA